MINPKQGFHSFGRLYQAKAAPAPARANVFGEFAAAIAGGNAIHETDANPLLYAQKQHSISTIEELAALARIDARAGTNLLQSLGLPPDIAGRVLGAMESFEGGKQLMQELTRFEQFKYELGYDIDLNNPPPPNNFLQPVAVFGNTFAGAMLSAIDPDVVGAPGKQPAAPVPPTTTINLIDEHMPEIKDQGARGTCVAFTSVACLEYHLSRFGNLPDTDLSEQFQYWSMVSNTGQRNLVSGYPLLPTNGVCREITWPYYANPIPGNDTQAPPPAPAPSQALAFRCNTVRQVSARSVVAIQDELQKGRLVGIGIPVYRSWMESGAVRLSGNITVPIPGEVAEGIGHAITLVGYADDAEFAGGGYFIVRNSWGDNWGLRNPYGIGYGTIPYRYISDFNWDAWCIVS